jgi:ribulose-5-phosphate 4-epimerase/fuculose-1-phosphate aldolase
VSDDVVTSAIGQLVMANRILANEGVIDDFGHISLRHPLRSDRYFLSCSRSPELVTRADIMEFTLDGEPIDAQGRSPYRERVIHGATYAARPDVMSVAHHHARSVLPFAMNGLKLRPVFHMGAILGREVPVWDSRNEFGDTNMLVETAAQGRSMAAALGQGRCVLLRAHGATCVGASLQETTFVSIYMKENADLQLRMLPLGEPTYLSPGEIEQASAMLLSPLPARRTWEYRKARAGFADL